MNAQQMFDKVAKHLLTQGRKSYLNNSVLCAYRGPSGLKCAIGCLIPDTIYTPEMEGRTVGSILESFPILSTFIPDEHLAFSLQIVHDQVPPERWKHRLAIEAKEFHLSAVVLQTL